MASKNLFKNTGVTARSPAADTVNLAGGRAYGLASKEALAQLACTGCFNKTFYASAKDQLTKVKELAAKCDPDFLGKLAIYSRERGFLKDMPAFLVAWLTGRVTEAQKRGASKEADDINALLWEVFPRVIDNGKMLKNYVQIVRSGETGRKSLGTVPRRLIRSWLENKDDDGIVFSSVGNDPSLADVIKLAHPRPMTPSREALYGYFCGAAVKVEGMPTFRKMKDGKEIPIRAYDFKKLPQSIQDFENFTEVAEAERGKLEIPKVPFEMVEGLPLTTDQWKQLALRQSFQSLRQRLNTLNRKGVFGKEGAWDTDTIKAVAAKLRDREAIKKAKVMPYQLLIAYLNMGPEIPRDLTEALQDAMEIATENVPVINGPVVVMPDISGSMHSPLTGERVNAKTGKVEMHTSKVRCVDVAALVAASFLRTNPHAVIIPFESKALTDVRLNPRDSVMTNAEKLRNLPCGGTNCSAALKAVNDFKLSPALCVFVSDNESWLDSSTYGQYSNWGTSGYGSTSVGTARTATLREWDAIKKRAPNAKLVCLDITPNTTTQAPSRDDILNIGGFSDSCFDVMAAFSSGTATSWVDVIEGTE